jgi:hypothetical protein
VATPFLLIRKKRREKSNIPTTRGVCGKMAGNQTCAGHLLLENGGKINPILHTAWLDNHALTLKRNTAVYYFGEKSNFLHTFLKICCESGKIYVSFKNILLSMLYVI